MGTNMDQRGGEMAVSTQSSNKRMNSALGTGSGKGKKAMGMGRGKAKIISTGHRMITRGKRSGDENNEGLKKQKKMATGSSEMMIFGELNGLDISIVEGRGKGSMLEENVAGNTKQYAEREAEIGESQPRLEP